MSINDTDILIQGRQGRTLQDIVDSDGHLALRRIEEDVLLSVSCRNHVISTGGSAAYSHAAMTHLQQNGVIVFLHAGLQTLRRRITNYDTRGLAKRPDQSFEDLFAERFMLYQRYADITIECDALTQEEVCLHILRSLQDNDD